MAEPTGNPRPWYRNLPLIWGLSFIALGLGNWITGSVHLAEHAQVVAEPHVAGRSRGHDAATDAEMEVARVRMDFYHVVTSGGRLMTGAGIVLAAFGLARSLRSEARRSDRKQGT